MSELVEVGKYIGEIEEYGWYESERGERHPTVVVQFKLRGMYNSKGQLESCPEVSRTFRQAFTEKTATWLLHNLKAMGFVDEDLSNFDPQKEGGANLYGNRFDIVCTHDSYDGNVHEQWMIESRRRRLTRDDLAPLQAKFAAEIAKVMGQAAYEAPAADQPVEQPVEQPADPNGAAPPRKSRNGKAAAKAKAVPSGAPLVDANPDDSVPF